MLADKLTEVTPIHDALDAAENPGWSLAGGMQKKGKRRVCFARLKTLDGWMG